MEEDYDRNDDGEGTQTDLLSSQGRGGPRAMHGLF
jgi:hypothetical protein